MFGSPEENANDDGPLCSNDKQQPGEFVTTVGLVAVSFTASHVRVAVQQGLSSMCSGKIYDVVTAVGSYEMYSNSNSSREEVGHPEKVPPV